MTSQEALAAHNKYRGLTVTKHSVQNMMKMIWDPEVAMVAQKWAENCKTEHDGNRERFIPGESTQNRNSEHVPNLSVSMFKTFGFYPSKVNSFLILIYFPC